MKIPPYMFFYIETFLVATRPTRAGRALLRINLAHRDTERHKKYCPTKPNFSTPLITQSTLKRFEGKCRQRGEFRLNFVLYAIRGKYELPMRATRQIIRVPRAHPHFPGTERKFPAATANPHTHTSTCGSITLSTKPKRNADSRGRARSSSPSEWIRANA
jgi:hypothetical protein